MKNFRKDDLGNYDQAVVTFLDNNRSGQVDLEDKVVEYSEEATGSETPAPKNDTAPRYLPEAQESLCSSTRGLLFWSFHLSEQDMHMIWRELNIDGPIARREPTKRVVFYYELF